MRGMLKSLGRGAVVFGRKPVTIHYPDEKRRLPTRARTFPYLIWNHDLDEPNCTGCGKCAKACPVDCMTTTLKKNSAFADGRSNHKSVIDDFYIDFGRCMRCNICVEVCPFDAIAMLPIWEGHEQSKFDRRELVMDLDDLLAPSRAEPDMPFWIPETVLQLTKKERTGRADFTKQLKEAAATDAPTEVGAGTG